MPPKLVKAASTSAPDSIATVAEKAAGAQGVTPKAAGNMELSPVVTVPSQNTLSTHGMQSAGAPAPAAAAAFPPSPSNGSCGGAAAADDSKKTSSLGTPSATSSSHGATGIDPLAGISQPVARRSRDYWTRSVK